MRRGGRSPSMTTFDDRERGQEGKFVLDQDTEFRAQARRNRALGRWAGELLGKSGEDLDAYAASVVRSELAAAGDEDVLRRVAGDLTGHTTSAEVRLKMDALLIEARAQVQAG